MPLRSDATHTYRGYRQQALYILWRILNDVGDDLVFQPEGVEDLAVFDSTGETLIEVTQVKDHSTNLTLSTFAPDKTSSFFYRVAERQQEQPDLLVKIASFGDFGESFSQALGGDTAQLKKQAEQLSGYGILSSVADAISVLSAIVPEKVSGEQMREEIDTKLGNLLLGEPETAFESLSFWIYICSETKRKITRQNIIDKVNSIREFIKAQSAQHLIVALKDKVIETEERDLLQSGFSEGVAARYEHILANLDVLRPQRLQQIHDAFQGTNVVIVHGTSGQGKTTLAFRYLRDYTSAQWRFFVHSPEGRAQALSIAHAISSHAQAIDIPVMVYLDVRPSETNWTDTVRELAFIPNVRVLVTIREDDLRRATFPATDFPRELLELEMDESEAREIYDEFARDNQPADFTDFEAAWQRFGEHGPLMEFVYLLTKGTSLRDRLEQQITAIKDEVIHHQLDEDILQLLRLVAIASSFGARLERRQVATALSLSVPDRFFERLEKEYLIKIDEDQFLVDGVHPIRSNILKDLLVDEFIDWPREIEDCLKCIFEPDIGYFLLELFIREPEQSNVTVSILEDVQPKTWIGVAGVSRSLIWLGVKRFVECNEAVLAESYEQFGTGAIMLLDTDIAGALPEPVSFLDVLGRHPDVVERAKQLKSRLTGIDDIFEYAKTWLSNYSNVPLIPADSADWSGLAESIFWLRHLQINQPVDERIEQIPFEELIPTLSLDILSDVGFALAHQRGITDWHSRHRQSLLERFKSSTNTMVVEIQENNAVLHYVFDLQESYDIADVKDPINYESVRRVDWFAGLFPEYEVIGTQGYGHRIADLDIHDSSVKNIPRKNLSHPKWLVWVNGIYAGLFRWPHRPENWQEYVDRVVELRQQIIRMLTQYERELEKYFQRKKSLNLFDNLITQQRSPISSALMKQPLLPKCAVDPWGFITEGETNNPFRQVIEKSEGDDKPSRISTGVFNPVSKALQKYTGNLSTFFNQSQHALAITGVDIRITTEEQHSQLLQALAQSSIEESSAKLSVLNLFESWLELPTFQREFRQHFTPFVGEQSLSRLERQEIQAFERLWGLWYFFVYEPYQITQNARVRFNRIFQDQLEQFKQRLRTALEAQLAGNCSVVILENSIIGEHGKALTVTVDSGEGWPLYQQLIENLPEILASVFQDVQVRSTEYYAIQINVERILILPLIRGKLLNQTSFQIPTLTMLVGSKPSELVYQFQRLPDEIMSQLVDQGISLHLGENVTIAREFMEDVANMRAVVAHLHDLASLLAVEDVDMSSLQEYVNRATTQLNEIRSRLTEHHSRIESMISNHEFHNQEDQELVTEAAELLQATLFPEGIDEGPIGLEPLGAWSGLLTNALGTTLVLSAIIASDEI